MRLANASNIPGGLGVSYSWMGNLNPASGTGERIDITVPLEGQTSEDSLRYTLTITTDIGNCTREAIIVLPIQEPDFKIPELITPNGDGTNEIFKVFFAGEMTDFTMTVFIRWGQKIFTSTNADEGWDGTKNGTPQNTDTYLYIAKFRLNGTEFEEDGQFSLIR